MSVNAINRYINTFKDLNTSNSKKLENKSSQSQLVSTVIESDGIQNNYIQKAIENTKELDESNIIYRIFNFIRKMMPNWQNSRSSLKEKDALSYTEQLIDQLGKTNLSHIIFKDKGFEKKFIIKDGEIEFNKDFKVNINELRKTLAEYLINIITDLNTEKTFKDQIISFKDQIISLIINNISHIQADYLKKFKIYYFGENITTNIERVQDDKKNGEEIYELCEFDHVHNKIPDPNFELSTILYIYNNSFTKLLSDNDLFKSNDDPLTKKKINIIMNDTNNNDQIKIELNLNDFISKNNVKIDIKEEIIIQKIKYENNDKYRIKSVKFDNMFYLYPIKIGENIEIKENFEKEVKKFADNYTKYIKELNVINNLDIINNPEKYDDKSIKEAISFIIEKQDKFDIDKTMIFFTFLIENLDKFDFDENQKELIIINFFNLVQNNKDININPRKTYDKDIQKVNNYILANPRLWNNEKYHHIISVWYFEFGTGMNNKLKSINTETAKNQIKTDVKRNHTLTIYNDGKFVKSINNESKVEELDNALSELEKYKLFNYLGVSQGLMLSSFQCLLSVFTSAKLNHGFIKEDDIFVRDNQTTRHNTIIDTKNNTVEIKSTTINDLINEVGNKLLVFGQIEFEETLEIKKIDDNYYLESMYLSDITYNFGPEKLSNDPQEEYKKIDPKLQEEYKKIDLKPQEEYKKIDLKPQEEYKKIDPKLQEKYKKIIEDFATNYKRYIIKSTLTKELIDEYVDSPSLTHEVKNALKNFFDKHISSLSIQEHKFLQLLIFKMNEWSKLEETTEELQEQYSKEITDKFQILYNRKDLNNEETIITIADLKSIKSIENLLDNNNKINGEGLDTFCSYLGFINNELTLINPIIKYFTSNPIPINKK